MNERRRISEEFLSVIGCEGTKVMMMLFFLIIGEIVM